ncbi:hypothetical protein CW368_12020 [Actinomycetales bacterium SN12]|nr:hypothetical protein CW368_12020 [Actinomycetales bacterium SN12]
MTAKLKSADEFIAASNGADVTKPRSGGKSLLMYTVGNTSLPDRYIASHWLLDQGCPLGAPNSEGYTELHVLFGQVEHDIAEDVRLARRLIEIGADVNAVSPRGGLVFCEVLRMKYTDEDLEPIYSLWFEQPVVLDFQTPSKHGTTPLAWACNVPYRASIVERMERYLAEHA